MVAIFFFLFYWAPHCLLEIYFCKHCTDTVGPYHLPVHTRLEGPPLFFKGQPPRQANKSTAADASSRRQPQKADHSRGLWPSAAASKDSYFAPRPMVSFPCRRLRFPAERLHFFSWPHLLGSPPAFAACCLVSITHIQVWVWFLLVSIWIYDQNGAVFFFFLLI